MAPELTMEWLASFAAGSPPQMPTSDALRLLFADCTYALKPDPSCEGPARGQEHAVTIMQCRLAFCRVRSSAWERMPISFEHMKLLRLLGARGKYVASNDELPDTH